MPHELSTGGSKEGHFDHSLPPCVQESNFCYKNKHQIEKKIKEIVNYVVKTHFTPWENSEDAHADLPLNGPNWQ
jgi:hypothetical protein